MNEQELRELDAWIAEHVIGWKWYRCGYRGRSYCPESGRIRFNFLPHPQSDDWLCTEVDISQVPQDQIADKWTPHYTTDRAASQEVLERCLTITEVHLMPPVESIFAIWGGGRRVQAESLPLAICLFAKKLFGKE